MKNYTGTIIYALAIITGTIIISAAYKYKFKSSETISVTGMAEKDFSSDLIVWGGSFTKNGMEIKEAYASLKEDENSIKSYLNQKGIPDSCIIFTSVNMTKNFQRQYDERGNLTSEVFSGFSLSENLRVESSEIDRVEKKIGRAHVWTPVT